MTSGAPPKLVSPPFKHEHLLVRVGAHGMYTICYHCKVVLHVRRLIL